MMSGTRTMHRTGVPAILLLLVLGARSSFAEDWGAYAIIPVSAPALVLESVGQEVREGASISIGKPTSSANQKWVIVPSGENLFAIKPASSSTLVLSVTKGGTAIGTPIALEVDGGQPWQRWELKKNENGSYCLLPKHAPGKGLDHLGGDPTPGAKIDLWANNAGDQHLQWMIKPLAGSLPAANASGETPPSDYVPPEVKPEDILKGRIESFPYRESKIFPGTVRQVTVFIPAQYDGTKPACVSVKTDGYNPAEKSLLETLIASKEMPVTVGVFVTPGELPSGLKGSIGRRNRCLEYDGMGDDNVRFLVDEILPLVAEKYKLKLSTSGNDRCIAGGSSGGIAAFNAAWERPEAFSRVYANSGSFVAFRGGHEFPTLVRKFEPRPIRAYLTTGMRDMENCAGDWFLLDQEMDKGLKFSGYDYTFRIINGGHVAGYYAHYPEAMSYLWKDWPKPVAAGPGAPRVRDILLPNEPWELVDSTGIKDASGPAVDASGEVFFTDAAQNKIYRIGPGEGDAIKPFSPDAGHANSLCIGPQGEIYSVSRLTGKVMKSNPISGEATLVVDGIRGQQILATPGGGLYVTCQGEASGEVWFIKDGKKSLVDSGLKFASGLAYRPDGWLLSVADGHSKWAYSYQINADGTLSNKERFFPLYVPENEDDAGAGSICYAKEGPMLVATRSGIQACADDGPTQVILPMPDRRPVHSICLGGRDFDMLYAFCGDKIWRRKVKVHGFGAFTPPAPVRGSSL